MKRPKSDALIADIEKNPARALGATRAAERARARSARLMVWPIDAPKGRFPSKIAHYRGEGRGTPIYPAAYPQPDTPTSHNSTTHANQVRSATSHCCVPTAASRQWALQPRRLLLTPLAALQHCRPSAAVRCSRRHPIIVLPASAQHSSIKGVGARGSCVRGAAIIPERKKSSDANKEQPLTGPPRHEVQPAAAALECSRCHFVR